MPGDHDGQPDRGPVETDHSVPAFGTYPALWGNRCSDTGDLPESAERTA